MDILLILLFIHLLLQDTVELGCYEPFDRIDDIGSDHLL